MVLPAIAVIAARELGQEAALRILRRISEETGTPIDDAAVAILTGVDLATDLRRGARAALDPTTPLRMLAPMPAKKKRKKRGPSAYNKMFAKHYASERKKATLKSGRLRKGITHQILMQRAHKCCRRDLKGRRKK